MDAGYLSLIKAARHVLEIGPCPDDTCPRNCRHDEAMQALADALPDEDPPGGSCLSGDPIPGHVCTDCPPAHIEASLGKERIEEAVRRQWPQKQDATALATASMSPEQWAKMYEIASPMQTPLDAGKILGASKMHGARNLLARAKGLLQQAYDSDEVDRHVRQSGRAEHMLSQVRSILHRGGLEFEDFSSDDRQAILSHATALLKEE